MERHPFKVTYRPGITLDLFSHVDDPKSLVVVAAADLAAAEARAEKAEGEVDCGQDAVCAKAPGCQRHWHERNRELASELAEARRQLGEADEKLLAIAGIVNGYHNDTAEAASWDCLRAIATVLGPPWADAEDGGAFVAGEAK